MGCPCADQVALPVPWSSEGGVGPVLPHTFPFLISAGYTVDHSFPSTPMQDIPSLGLCPAKPLGEWATLAPHAWPHQ
jgi:hypothetical protein